MRPRGPTSPSFRNFSQINLLPFFTALAPSHSIFRNFSGSRAQVFLAGAAIAVAAVAAYHNSLSGQFAFDDVPTIVDNPTIRHLWDLRSVFSPPPGGFTVSGRPVLNLSLAINYAFGGKNVWGYHATNLVIHILAGLTLFGIMRRTLERWSELPPTRSSAPSNQRVGGNPLHLQTTLAFAVALIWTVHPLTTESVTYIIQRAESLMGLFYLLTLYCFIRSVDFPEVGRRAPATPSSPPELRSEGAPGAGRPTSICFAVFSIVFCLLGMATKEVMVSAPVIVLLYDRTFVAGAFGEASRRRRKYYLGLSSTWILLVYLALGTGSRGSTAGMNVAVSNLSYWLTQFPAIAHYLALVVWPTPLVLDYGSRVVRPTWSLLLPITVVVVLAVTTLRALTGKSRAFGFAGFFFFAILAPTSVVPVVVQVMAEHRMYLALAPVVAVLVAGGYGLFAKAGSKAGIPGSPIRFYLPLCLAVAAGLAFVTASRNEDYRNELTLWGKTAAESPDNPRAQYNFGLALSDAGNIPAAMERYRIALRIKPAYPEAHNNLGIALSDTGHWSEAMTEYLEAVRLDPRFAKAYYNLGNAFLHFDRLPEAIANYEEARRLSPDIPDFDYNLGTALAKEGRTEEAMTVFEHDLRFNPDDPLVHINLGVIFAERGRFPEAIDQYKDALRLKPGLAKAHNGLGTALASTGRLEEATAQFEEAVRLDPDFPEARLNLGRALMLSGRLEEARAQIEAANGLRSTPPSP